MMKDTHFPIGIGTPRVRYACTVVFELPSVVRLIGSMEVFNLRPLMQPKRRIVRKKLERARLSTYRPDQCAFGLNGRSSVMVSNHPTRLFLNTGLIDESIVEHNQWV